MTASGSEDICCCGHKRGIHKGWVMDGACSKCGPQSCEKFHTIGEGHLSPFIVIGFLAFSMLLSYAFYTSILKNRKERPNATIQNTQSR